MARRKQTRGICGYCGRELARTGMPRHLPSCQKRREAVATLDREKGEKTKLFHLRVFDSLGGDFWLDMDCAATTVRRNRFTDGM